MSREHGNHVLNCNGLSVGYKDKAVLSGLDLAFEAGHFISLLGPNGAGKTTLLRTLSRHLAPLSGRIEVLGRPLPLLTGPGTGSVYGGRADGQGVASSFYGL